MANLLKDPRTGDAQFVNSLGMAHTISVTYGIGEFYAKSGDAYNFNTGTINLTSGNASAVAYVENNEDHDLVVTALFYLLGGNTGGSATSEHLVEVFTNPTAVSFSTAKTPANRNAGSSNTLNGNFYVGAEGATITNGTDAIDSLFTSEDRKVLTVGAIVLPKGKSLAVRITPKSGTTNMNVQCAFGLYLDKKDLLGA